MELTLGVCVRENWGEKRERVMTSALESSQFSFAFFLDMKGVTKGRWCGMELWLEVSAGGLELLFYAKMHNYEG